MSAPLPSDGARPSAGDDETLYAFRRNLVVAASAGTGKTFRLVSLYVLLTLGLTSKGQSDETIAAAPVSPRAILATTFSRAAALEIRHRVVQLLRVVATGREDARMAAYLGVLDRRAHRLGLSGHADAVLRQRAQEALAELPLATIDTLHGVASQIVRANAMELGVSPAFAIAEEEAAMAQAAAVFDQVLVRALEREEPAARELLLLGGGLHRLRTHVLSLLDRAAEEGVRIRDLEVTDPLPAFFAMLDELDGITAALIDEGSKTFGEGARAVAAALPTWRAGTATEKEIARALDLLLTPHAPRKRLESEQALLAFRDGLGAARNHAERAAQLAGFFAAAPSLQSKAEALRGLLDEAAEDLLAARIRAGSLAFSDLLRLSRDVLRDRPSAAARTRERFEVLLVDEFQDTSRVQRDIVYLLRERADRAATRARGGVPRAEDLEPSGLLVVGDRKQSIYAFRGADVSVFGQVCAELAGEQADVLLGGGRAEGSSGGAGFLALSENRRSTPSVLSFVNEFATLDFAAPHGLPFEIRYAEAERLRAPAGTADGAAVTVITDDGTSPADAEPLVRGATGALREALIAAALVESVVRAGAAKARRCGEFAILARRRATLPLLEFALARLEIPYCVAGRNLFGTPEVRDLLALLQLLLDPSDSHALAAVLRGPALGLTDLALTLLAEPGRGLAAEPDWPAAPARLLERLEGLRPARRAHATREAGAVDSTADEPERDEDADKHEHKDADKHEDKHEDEDRARLEAFAARWDGLQKVALGLGPADALRATIEHLELDYVWSGLPRAPQRLGNVTRLIALAAERGGSLSSFVRWLQKNVAEQHGEQEAAVVSDLDDAVTLLTIHASKGLEFKSVVVVDLGASQATDTTPMALWPGSGVRGARLFFRHRRRDGSALVAPELSEHRADTSARERAERQRLTYVAFTRAREELYLVGVGKAKDGSAMATLTQLLDEPEAKLRSGAETVTAAEVLEQAMHSSGGASVPAAPQGSLQDAQQAPPQGAQQAPPQAAQQAPPQGAQQAPPQGAQQAPPQGAQQAPPQGAQQASPQGSLQDAPQPSLQGATQGSLQDAQQAPLQGVTMKPSEESRDDGASCPSLAVPRTLSFTTAELTAFAQCPRRYRLLCELGLREPAWPTASSLGANDRPHAALRPIGAAERTVLAQWPLPRWGRPTEPTEVAHALMRAGFVGSEALMLDLATGLSRWLASPFAAEVRERSSGVRRAEPFVLAIHRAGGGTLSIRGTLESRVRARRRFGGRGRVSRGGRMAARCGRPRAARPCARRTALLRGCRGPRGSRCTRPRVYGPGVAAAARGGRCDGDREARGGARASVRGGALVRSVRGARTGRV